jgi:hypothetical protein
MAWPFVILETSDKLDPRQKPNHVKFSVYVSAER